jgi:hypothetical protein
MVLALAPATASADDRVPNKDSAAQSADGVEPISDAESVPGDKIQMRPAERPGAAFPEKEADPGTSSALDAKPAEEKPEEPDCVVTDSEKKDPVPLEMSPKSDVYENTDMKLGWNSFTVSTGGDVVYQRFTAPVSGTYRFFTFGDDDTVGYLRNDYGELLTSDDDAGYVDNFCITYDLTEGRLYYIGFKFFSSDTTGTAYIMAERFVTADLCREGRSWFDILTAGDTVYRTFTPSVSGTYHIYSLSDDDTFAWIAYEDDVVFQYNDDGGYNNQFELTVDLSAGSAYRIGVRYYDTETQNGSIPVIIERQDVQTEPLHLGINWLSVNTAGETVYRSFTVPFGGYYWIFSAQPFSGTLSDTIGKIADDSMKVYMCDDDSGTQSCFLMQISNMKEGDVINIGASFYDPTLTGSIPVIISYPWEEYDEWDLKVGDNTYNVEWAGSLPIVGFTPTESGTYRIRSTGNSDIYGVLFDSELRPLLYHDDVSGSDENFMFEYDMEANETYFVGACFWDCNTTGTFNVNIKNLTGSSLPAFDGTIEWNPSDVQFKGATPYVVYHGAAFTPRFTVKDKNGAVVNPSHYTYEYRENVNAGTGYVIVTFNDLYAGKAQGWFKIYLPPTSATTVENVQDGIRIKWEPVTGAAGYVVYRRAWSTTTNGWTDFLRWNNTTALSYTDTSVYAGTRYQYGVKAYFAQRTDPVSGATIGGNVGDNYNLGMVGPLKTTVRITTRTLSKLEAGSGRVTAYWDASKVFTGYQIKYATNAAFSKNVKSVWISDAKTASKVITGLTNGTTYYFCVRSYHVFEGTKYFGQWSNALSIKPGSAGTVTPKSYRALLVGEVNFNWGDGSYETAKRNGGDVEHMASMLKSVKGSNGSAYTVTKKTNLGKSGLENAIKNTFSGTTDQDVSLFFIATHGDSSDEGQLVLTDGSNCTQWISFGQLAAMLSKYVKGDVIVIIESCGAGSAIYANGAKAQDFDPELFAIQAVQAFAEADQKSDVANTGELRKSRYYVLAAAKHHQDSWGHEWEPAGNYFTDWLIEGIGDSGSMPADTNKDNVVTLNELYKYIAKYDTYTFSYLDSEDHVMTATQQVQVYPVNSSYKLFKR